MSGIPSADVLVPAALWSAATIAAYWFSKRVYRRWPRWWLSPLAATPVLLTLALIAWHTDYGQYIRGTHWLVALLGPATVAFAIPIYEQRAIIRRDWPVLIVGVVAGSATAMLSAWLLARAFGLNGALLLSLLPRSMSTPFAMAVSQDIGGEPNLTAVFVILTGIFGLIFGEMLLAHLPIRTSLARGALLGVGAHGAGTAKAHEIGAEEGSIAGLVMVLVGLLNVLAGPLLAHFF